MRRTITMKKLTAAALAVCMTAGMMTGCSAPEPEETTAPSKALRAQQKRRERETQRQ